MNSSAVSAPALALEEEMARNPGAVFEVVAQDYGVTIKAVLAALPRSMRRFGPGSGFIAAMKDIAGWGDVTLIVHTEDGIMEFTGPVPDGEVGRGHYNLMSRTGFHGHLRHERCADIAFVERPFMGRSSACVVLLNTEGGAMFKVFVGRTENGELREDQLAQFRALGDLICRNAPRLPTGEVGQPSGRRL